MDKHSMYLAQALSWAKAKHQAAPPEHQAAFANSVAYALTGLAGGYGGPCAREHVASSLGRDSSVREFEPMCHLLEDSSFGPITEAHRAAYASEYCFDDSMDDIEAILHPR